MKKILISVLIVLLLFLTYMMLDKGINLGFIKINSIKDIKNESANLDKNMDRANELSNKTYPTEIEGLEDAIRKLKISKQDYENKKTNNENDEGLGTVEIKTYTIHYLWTILGNYRENAGVRTITLDLKSTENVDVYDLDFTLIGNYTSITDFIYDIENDEELNFEIKNFIISSVSTKKVNTEEQESKVPQKENDIASNNNSKNEEEKKDNSSDYDDENGTILQATFTVENIGITLE